MSDPATFYFTQGILGVTCIVLALVCMKLYNKNQELHDARLQDQKDVTKDVTSVLQGNTQSNYVLAEKIEAGKKGSS